MKRVLYFVEHMIFKATEQLFARQVIAASGPVKHEDVVSQVKSLFTKLPSNSTTSSQLVKENPSIFTGSEVRIIDDDAPLAQFAVAFEGASLTDPDSIALMVMQAMLGSWNKSVGDGKFMGSEMAQRVGISKIAESMVAFNANYKDTGLFGVHAVAKLLTYDRRIPFVKLFDKIDDVDGSTVNRVATRRLYSTTPLQQKAKEWKTNGIGALSDLHTMQRAGVIIVSTCLLDNDKGNIEMAFNYVMHEFNHEEIINVMEKFNAKRGIYLGWETNIIDSYWENLKLSSDDESEAKKTQDEERKRTAIAREAQLEVKIWGQDNCSIRGVKDFMDWPYKDQAWWAAPPKGAYKLNTDGCFNEATKQAGGGGVIRDSKGIISCCIRW